MGIFGLNKCEQSTDSLNAAILEMIRRHSEGEIDFIIDSQRFIGIHRDITENINNLVKAHIDVKMKIVDIAASYGNGDLSVEMERLPGKKGLITQAMDSMREKLRA